MKKTMAIIWRESVYKNDFKCSCGQTLMENREIDRSVLYNPHEKILICPKCHEVVAMIKDGVEVDNPDNWMRGEWHDA